MIQSKQRMESYGFSEKPTPIQPVTKQVEAPALTLAHSVDDNPTKALPVRPDVVVKDGEAVVTTMEKIAQLRNEEELSNKNIGERLGLTPHTIRTYASALIQKGIIASRRDAPRPETRKKWEEVKNLRKLGLSNQDIAKMLELKPRQVSHITHQLLKRDQIEHLPKGKPYKNSIMAQVETLRNQGYKNPDIAEKLGVSYGVVAQCTIRLLKKGKIEPHRQRTGDRPK